MPMPPEHPFPPPAVRQSVHGHSRRKIRPRHAAPAAFVTGGRAGRPAHVALVSDVRCGIIETNGQLSVLPYADKQPLTPSDLGKHPKDAGMARVLIFEGKIRRGVLRQLGKDEAWLLRTCRARGIHAPEDVFLLTLDDCGNLFVQTREVRR